MHIHFLLTQDMQSPSGQGRYLSLAQELVKLGHRVEISALHADLAGVSDRHPIMEGVAVHYVAPMHVHKTGNVKHYYSPAQLARIVAQSTIALTRSALTIPADIVHVGKPHPMNSMAGLMAAGLGRAKLAVDCDDFEAASNHYTGGQTGGWQRRGVALFEDRIPGRAALVTTNTDFTRRRLVGLGVDPARIAYVPNGVDPDRFAPSPPQVLADLRRRWVRGAAPVVVYVGSMSLANHPVDLLLRAFGHLLRVMPSALLLMVGGGHDFDPLVALAAELGLGDRVRFIGRVDATEVPHFFRLGHVSVDPVHDDDAARGRMPLKLVESWAAGVPFVTADVGDRQHLLGDPPAGVMVAPGSPDALAQGLIQVLNDPAYAHALAQRGEERAAPFYWAQVAANLDRAYTQLLAG